MDHNDHKRLIRDAIPSPAGLWGDLGSGTGAFTLALAGIGGDGVKIFSIDTDQHALAMQHARFARSFPDADITFLNDDFTKNLPLPKLDGIILANSLHFHKDKLTSLKKITTFLKPGAGSSLLNIMLMKEMPGCHTHFHSTHCTH